MKCLCYNIVLCSTFYLCVMNHPPIYLLSILDAYLAHFTNLFTLSDIHLDDPMLNYVQSETFNQT